MFWFWKGNLRIEKHVHVNLTDHFTNIKKITETEEVTVDLLKFKENVYDKIKETLTEKQKRKLTQIEGIM